MHIIPRRIPGSKTSLSDNLTVSILIDRAMLFECGTSVLLIVTAEVAKALFDYLQRHSAKFQTGGQS